MKSIYNHGLTGRLIVFLLLSSFALLPQAQVSSQGPYCGRLYQSDASNDGTLYWVNAAGAQCDEDANRTATDPLAAGQYTHLLRITNFGFNIPSNAHITGIEVVVIRRTDHESSVRDRSVQLLRQGQPIEVNKSVPELWDTEWTAVYYGDENDLWGNRWTAADLNRDDFGVVLSVGFGKDEGQPQIDEVLLTVHYEQPDKNIPSANFVKAPSKFTCHSLGS